MKNTALNILTRSAKKRYFAFLLNVLGLSFGLSSVLFITIYSIDELSHDKHITDHDRIYRVVTEYKTNSGSDLSMAESFPGVSPMLRTQFSQVQASVRVFPHKGSITIQYKSGNNRVFEAENVFKVDKEFFDVFKHPFIEGNPTAFSKPYSMVITQSLAKKLFGNQSPINKAVIIDHQTYGVVGVINDLPKNSDLYYEALLSHDFSMHDNDWGNPAGFTYVLLSNSDGAQDLEFQINAIATERALSYYGKEYAMESTIKLSLQPLITIHFSKQLSGDSVKGNPAYLKVLITLGTLILIIVIFNHSSFSTSLYTERIHEVAVRKLMGIDKNGLIRQFVFESFAVAVLTFLISIILLATLLPYVNQLTGKSLSFFPFANYSLLTISTALFLLVILAGSFYPIFYSFRGTAISGLKGYSGMGNNRIRKVLVVGQLTFTTFLVFFTLTVHHQIHFLRNINLGFATEKIVMLSLPQNESENEIAWFVNELPQNNSDSRLSLINELSYPGSERMGYQLGWIFNNNNRVEAYFNQYEVDSLFANLLELKFLSGSNFTTQNNGNNKQAIVNNAFVKMAGFETPTHILDETIHAFDEQITIVGVVSDFHYQDLTQPVKPLVITPINSSGLANGKILLKLKNLTELENVKSLYLKLFSSDVFNYTFLETKVDKMLEQEKTTGRVTQVFSLTAILLAAIGLYSLSSLTLGQRAKEIGIRKILGITQSSLVMLMSKEFFIIVLISLGIAIPFAWSTSHLWLSEYVIRIDQNITTIGQTILILIAILMLGTIANIIRSTKVNPVDLLKNE